MLGLVYNLDLIVYDDIFRARQTKFSGSPPVSPIGASKPAKFFLQLFLLWASRLKKIKVVDFRARKFSVFLALNGKYSG